MFDQTDTNRPERRSSLIAHELSRLDVDVAALSEVCFPEEGSQQELGAGYTLFWSGKPATGVGFMQNIHCLQAGKPVNHSFRPHHVHAPPSEEQAVCNAF